MFSGNYFAARYFAPRYFPRNGGGVIPPVTGGKVMMPYYVPELDLLDDWDDEEILTALWREINNYHG